MAVVEYRKVKCDECGKEVEIKEPMHLPCSWLEIDITECCGASGTVVLSKEVCSRKCALNMLKKLKKIPKVIHRL